MNIQIVAAGKLTDKYSKEGCELYIEKLKHYCKLSVKEVDLKKTPSGENEIKKTESKLIIDSLKPQSRVVLLNVKGKHFSSEQFSKYIEKNMMHPHGISFCIGGSYGFSDELYNMADEKISFSEMTFNHRIFRIMLLEQIYRAFTIIRNEKYHHG